MSGRWLRFMAVMAGVTIVATSCRIDENSSPQAIALEGNAASLLETSSTTTSTTSPAATQLATLYFFRTTGDRKVLVPVRREFAVGAGLTPVLINLIETPPDTAGTERPEERDLSTTLAAETVELLAVSDPDASGVITINVRGLFGETGLTGAGLVEAAAQLVWTATGDRSVNGVRFLNAGEAVPAPLAEGDVGVDDAVSRDDYDEFSP